MNWTAIGALGETLGALAVLITIAYFAVQIRRMKSSINSDALAQQQSNENFLNSLMVDNAELIVKADLASELTEAEKLKVEYIYHAHASVSFHSYLRSFEIGSNPKVPPRVFAELIRRHAGFRRVWNETPDRKDRMVREWTERVQGYLDRVEE